MFTGLIQTVAELVDRQAQQESQQLTISTKDNFLCDVGLGDSICVNGVCLTVTKLDQQSFCVDVSAETLACTNFNDLYLGQSLNLEKALTLATRLGGHLVSGHVDGVGVVKQLQRSEESIQISIEAPSEIAKYIARKGSICVDGISLTVNQVSGDQFDVNIIPHTWENTAILDYQIGSQVNLEIDLLARYVERLHEYQTTS